MDMSFENQALTIERLFQHKSELENKAYGVPTAIDEDVTRVKPKPSAAPSANSPKTRSSTRTPGTSKMHARAYSSCKG